MQSSVDTIDIFRKKQMDNAIVTSYGAQWQI